jgi:hypothetical protein
MKLLKNINKKTCKSKKNNKKNEDKFVRKTTKEDEI